MPGAADVRSIETIEAFRASLIVYLSKSRPLLDDAFDEVSRTREWLRNDRLIYWENELRRRRKKLEEAQQALMSAQLASLREVTAAELIAVQRAKRAISEAEDKLKVVKKWMIAFDSRVEVIVKQLEHLRTMLAGDMPRAVIDLAETVRKLESYSERMPPRPVTSSKPEEPAP